MADAAGKHRFFAPEVVQTSAMDCGPVVNPNLLTVANNSLTPSGSTISIAAIWLARRCIRCSRDTARLRRSRSPAG